MLTKTQALAIDLLNRPADVQARTHKLKKVVPEPNSFFMDVKCPGCFQITYVPPVCSTITLFETLSHLALSPPLSLFYSEDPS